MLNSRMIMALHNNLKKEKERKDMTTPRYEPKAGTSGRVQTRLSHQRHGEEKGEGKRESKHSSQEARGSKGQVPKMSPS